MNRYEIEFVSSCPINGDAITYVLSIEAVETIRAEDIEATVGDLAGGLHEEIADLLWRELGGVQTMSARHRAVRIVTTRGGDVLPRHEPPRA